MDLPSAVAWRARAASRQASTLCWSREEGPRTVRTGSLDAAGVPVVMCCWRRTHRLESSLEMLAAQTTPVALHLWVNGDPVNVESAAIPVSVTQSSRNVGGFGRFYLARELAKLGHDRVVFIDDDQEFAPDTIQTLLDDHHAKSIAGWWAFRYDDQLERVRVEPGEQADYVGTGGMVVDTSVFTDSALFRCPRRWWFVEDIWLCHFVSRRGWRLSRSRADFAVVNDEHDLFRMLGDTKRRMVRRLQLDYR